MHQFQLLIQKTKTTKFDANCPILNKNNVFFFFSISILILIILRRRKTGFILGRAKLKHITADVGGITSSREHQIYARMIEGSIINLEPLLLGDCVLKGVT